jgi:hypothetical protein
MARHVPQRGTGREAGVRSAVALLRRLERSSRLRDACDAGWDDASAAQSAHNIVWEHLEAFVAAGDLAAMEGFGAVLSGFVASAVAGCATDAKELALVFAARQRWERAADEARADAGFRRFLAAATSPA